MNPTTGEPEPESVVGGIPASVVEGVPASDLPSTEHNPVSPILGIASFADTLWRDSPEQAVMLSMRAKSPIWNRIKTYLRLIELTRIPSTGAVTKKSI